MRKGRSWFACMALTAVLYLIPSNGQGMASSKNANKSAPSKAGMSAGNSMKAKQPMSPTAPAPKLPAPLPGSKSMKDKKSKKGPAPAPTIENPAAPVPHWTMAPNPSPTLLRPSPQPSVVATTIITPISIPTTPAPLSTGAPVKTPIISPVSLPTDTPVRTPTSRPVRSPTVNPFLSPTRPPTPFNGTLLDPNMGTSKTGEGNLGTSSFPDGGQSVLGIIPAGLADVYIRVESTVDVDVQLFDGSTRIVHRSGGSLADALPVSKSYNGVRIDYSGYQGEQRPDTFGQEYVFISGAVPSDFTVTISGFGSSGTATVYYRWGYYEGTSGLSGSGLKSALSTIIAGHVQISYSQCWTELRRTDQDNSNTNNVIGIYSRKSIPKADQDSGCSCNDYWNREHVWAQSLGNFNTNPGPGTDLHHLRAEDKSVNTDRSNNDFGEGGSPVPDCNGCFEVSQVSFEPPDVSKGKVARMLFYMATRYSTLTVIDGYGSSSGSGTIGDLTTLKKWNNQFPPTVEEYNRNSLVMDVQRNRNPFVDHPEWIDSIF